VSSTAALPTSASQILDRSRAALAAAESYKLLLTLDLSSGPNSLTQAVEVRWAPSRVYLRTSAPGATTQLILSGESVYVGIGGRWTQVGVDPAIRESFAAFTPVRMADDFQLIREGEVQVSEVKLVTGVDAYQLTTRLQGSEYVSRVLSRRSPDFARTLDQLGISNPVVLFDLIIRRDNYHLLQQTGRLNADSSFGPFTIVFDATFADYNLPVQLPPDAPVR
jgi:hypothetical protein